MNRRMMGQEKSLNDPIKFGETDEWQDWLVDDSLDQELAISQQQEYNDKKELLDSIFNNGAHIADILDRKKFANQLDIFHKTRNQVLGSFIYKIYTLNKWLMKNS